MTEWCSRAENSELEGVIGKECLWRKKITASVKLRLMWHSNFSFKSSVSSHLTFKSNSDYLLFCSPTGPLRTTQNVLNSNVSLFCQWNSDKWGWCILYWLFVWCHETGLESTPSQLMAVHFATRPATCLEFFLIGSFSGRLSKEGTHSFLQTQYGLKSPYIIFYNTWLEHKCSFFNSSKKHGVIIVQSSGVSPTLIPDPFTNKTKFLRRKSLLSA